MGLLGFNFFSSNGVETELENLFPLALGEKDFVRIDTINIFQKILTDVVERTQGLPDNAQGLLWDNCIASELHDGLITLLAKAMTDKKELFLTYDPALNLITIPKSDVEQQIRADYKKQGKSTLGLYISFANFVRADMIKIYSALEYCTVGSMNKSMRLSNSIQLKMNELRSSVGLSDAADAKAQGKKIAEGLKNGKDVLIDAKDSIETAAPDITATEKAMDRIEQKRSFYLGLPTSYLTGEIQKGLGDSGNADAKAIERGLKNYFFSVIKPVFEALFEGKKFTFKTEDFVQVDSAMNALKTFDITSNDYISAENKTGIVNKLLGLPENSKGDPPAKPEPPTTVLPTGAAPVGKPGFNGA